MLKPGGRFYCLEFSRVNNFVLRAMYDVYSFTVIPLIGRVVAGTSDPYRYLVESIRRFPNQEAFKEMIAGVGFQDVRYMNMTFGTVAIHSGVKEKAEDQEE